eukprot:scaffold22930_cov30-Phaeocystis_antarctica.AAC.1
MVVAAMGLGRRWARQEVTLSRFRRPWPPLRVWAGRARGAAMRSESALSTSCARSSRPGQG